MRRFRLNKKAIENELPPNAECMEALLLNTPLPRMAILFLYTNINIWEEDIREHTQ